MVGPAWCDLLRAVETEWNDHRGCPSKSIDAFERSNAERTTVFSHDKIILQHDNDRPHVALVVKTYLEGQNWKVLPHPPYSADIAPADYHLFRAMTHGLAEQHFNSYEECKKWNQALNRSN